MPQLSNNKHELYARNMAVGMTQIDAFVAAGYEHNYGNASTLANKKHVKDRVTELMDERRAGREIDNTDVNAEIADSEFGINEAWVVRQLKTNSTEARDAGQYAASNKALEILGKVCGLFDAPADPHARKQPEERPQLDMTKLAAALEDKTEENKANVIDVSPSKEEPKPDTTSVILEE